MDIDQQVMNAVQDGIRKGVCDKLGGYNSPLDKLIGECLAKHDSAFRSLLTDAIGGAVNDPEFRAEVSSVVRKKLTSAMIGKFGGELEKQVNTLRSDPTTRARITLAIDEIIKERMPA